MTMNKSEQAKMDALLSEVTILKKTIDMTILADTTNTTTNKEEALLMNTTTLDSNAPMSDAKMNELFDEKEIKGFEQLEKKMNGFFNSFVKLAPVAYVTKALNADAKDVYDIVIADTDATVTELYTKAYASGSKVIRKHASDATELSELKDAVILAKENLVAASSNKNATLATIKIIAVLIFKKVAAALRGTLKFLAHVAITVEVVVGRVAYHTVKELVYAGKEIGTCFNNDIIQAVRTA